MTGPAWIPVAARVWPDGVVSVDWRAGVGRHRTNTIDMSELPRIQRLRELHGYPPLVPTDQPLEAS